MAAKFRDYIVRARVNPDDSITVQRHHHRTALSTIALVPYKEYMALRQWFNALDKLRWTIKLARSANPPYRACTPNEKKAKYLLALATLRESIHDIRDACILEPKP